MTAPVAGRATSEGTKRYTKRHAGIDTLGGYRPTFGTSPAHGLRLSTVGIGTYLGAVDAATDEGYREAVEAAVGGGINVVDSAINYRHQRSERVVGEALHALLDAGALGRDEVFVATKGGFIPFDADESDARAAIQRDYVETGLLNEANVVGGMHCMDPDFLSDQIDRSRRNLGLATLDLFYVHNPETQVTSLDPAAFYDRLQAAFRMLEVAVDEGRVSRYGIATWDGLRVAPGQGPHVDLGRVVAAAEEAAAAVGHDRHHLEAMQAPLNLHMTEGVAAASQPDGTGRLVPLAEAVRARGLAWFTSGSLLQGRLAKGIPAQVRSMIGNGIGTDAQAALQAVRSAPGVTTALVGMSNPDHVQEALDLMARVGPSARHVWEASASAR